MFRLFCIALLLISIGCGSSRPLIEYDNRNVADYNTVIDSLKGAGNIVSVLDTAIFALNTGKMDTVAYCSFYDKKILGSMQVRRIDGGFNVILIKQ